MDVSSGGPLVLETLARACSQDASVLKPAELQLNQWETQPGFYTILTTIFSDHSIDINVRWLAVLYFKKGIDRYWRKNAPNGISEEEKDGLKRRLIQNFNEPVHQIATQLAVLTAKIARLDCPRSWPELIPTLLHAVKVNDTLLQQRALLTLHHVTKTLSSKRLAQDRKVFEELTSNIFAYIYELWTLHNENVFEIMSSNSNNVQGLVVAIDNSLLTLKVLRKLIVYGFSSPKENVLAMQFLEQVFTKLNIYLKSKDQLHLNSELVAKREKMATLLTKILLDAQEMHPETYIKFIQPTLQLCIFYNFTQQGKGLSYERLKVNAFNLLRSVLRSQTYRPAKIIEETKNPLTLEAHRIKMAFFTSSTLTEMCKQLILDYFPLTQDDLECWQTDPEGFVCDESGDAWKFSLRPCTENLYLTLFKEFRDTLTPIVLDLVKKYQGTIDPGDIQAVLSKDSVYNAVGLASFDLYDDVDFDQWFTNHLLQELQHDHPNYRIIHRRVTWLTGCWVGVKMSQDLRPTLCQVLLTLLQPNKDLVVRFEAANTLRLSIDDFEFQIDQFLPFLEPLFGSLFQLLKDVNECETKMKVLHVMSCVIERVDVKIQPHAGALIQYLPSLWQESEDHDMLRCAILTTLINLVQGLGVLCVNMYDLLLPVILMSTDVNQECHVYLVEDGLELWHMTLHQSPVMTPQLLALYDNLPELMESTTEHLKIIVKIIEAYLLLGAKEFMQKYASSLVNSITSVLNDLRSEGVIVVMKLVELVLKLFPDEGPRVFASLLPNIFSWAVHGEHYTTEKTVYYSILARVLLQNQTFFFQMLNTIASNSHKQVAEVCGDYLDNWVEHCDTAAQSTVDKKLNTMAMLSLVNTNSSVVLERFANILNIVVETLHSVCGLGEDSQLDRLWLNDDASELPDDSQETEHEKRKRQLSRQDPVHRVNLRDYVIQELMTYQQTHGQSALNMLMNTLDPKISEQLQEFIT